VLLTVAGRLGVPGQAVQQLVVMGQEPGQGLNPSLKLEVEYAMDKPRRPKSVIYLAISIVPGPLGVPGPSVQKLAEKGLEQRLGQRPLQRLEGEFAMDNPPRQKFAKWIVQSVMLSFSTIQKDTPAIFRETGVITKLALEASTVKPIGKVWTQSTI